MSIWPRGLIHVATWPRGLMHVAIWPRVNRGRDHVAACLQSTWPNQPRGLGNVATWPLEKVHVATWPRGRFSFFFFLQKKNFKENSSI
jgi:hypothetical protein